MSGETENYEHVVLFPVIIVGEARGVGGLRTKVEWGFWTKGEGEKRKTLSI